MNDALYIAATGMQAQQLAVDTTANNLANVNTVGFKKARVSFVDLVSRETASAADATGAAQAPLGAVQAPLGAVPLGAGVGVATVAKVFEAGDLKPTGAPLDVAIQGEGFLEVVLPDGSRGFTRGGSLKVNADGQLTSEAGYVLRPDISIPVNATAVAIGPDGRVRITVPGQARAVEAGQLELVRFANPGGLASAGPGTYRASEASGEAMAARPGEDGAGTLAQGYLEGSNVKLVDEMVGLMVAQRAYEASVKVIQAADEMQGLVNALRK